MTTDTKHTGAVSIRNPTLPPESDLYTEVPPVDVVSQEKVARLGRVATHFEKFHEVVVLAMDVTAHSDRRVHFQKIRLRLQDLRALPYDPERLVLGQATLAVKMLLEELEIGFRSVLWRQELLLRGRKEGGRLDIWRTQRG